MVPEIPHFRLVNQVSPRANLRGSRPGRGGLPARNQDNPPVNQESPDKRQFRCLERRSSTKARMRRQLQAANSIGRVSGKRARRQSGELPAARMTQHHVTRSS